MSTEYQPDQGNIPLISEGTSQQMMTVQSQQRTTTAPVNRQVFPVRTLKVFGGVQIGIGTIIGILSLIAVIVDSVAIHKECNRYNYEYDWPQGRCRGFFRRNNVLFAFDVTCLISSGWYLLTGFLPLCMSRKRQDSWRGLRVGFMVCCIIGASVFVPIMVTLGFIGCIKREPRYAVLSAFIVVLSLAEMIVAIISASYCCCCIPWSTDQTVTVLYRNAPQSGVIVSTSQNQVPMMTFQSHCVQGTDAHINITPQFQPPASDLPQPQVIHGPPEYKA